MAWFARYLESTVLSRPVIDKTGLDGSYDFRSATILTNDDLRNGDAMSMILPAVKEMGLKLTETNGAVETFVIDHAERPEAN